MIKKARPFAWDRLNFVALVLAVIVALLSHYWPQRPSPYWFVSYEWTRGKDRGAGRRCLAAESFDIVKTEDMIMSKNKYDSIILNNFIQIDKTTYDLCIAKP